MQPEPAWIRNAPAFAWPAIAGPKTRSDEAGMLIAVDCCWLFNDPVRDAALATPYEHLEVNTRF